MDAFCRFVTSVNEEIGRRVCLLFLPLLFVLMFEVVSRQFFNNPTIWSWDVVAYLAGTLAVMGGGYCLVYRGAHIILDIVYALFPARVKAMLDLLTSPIFFLGLVVFFWLSLGRVKKSIGFGEITDSLFQNLVWPLKVIIVVGILLLLLQGVVKFWQDLQIAIGRAKGNGA